MISRRRLLQIGGLTALGVGLSNRSLRAFIKEPRPPRRLILISHCHGWPYTAWRMHPPEKSNNHPWSRDLTGLDRSDFSEPLMPLYEHRRRLLPLDGLSLVTAELDIGGNRHDRGWIHSWTGNNANFSARDTRATSPSIDQLVAAHIASANQLPSLELSVDAALESGRPISYNPSGIRLPSEHTPRKAWDRVFGPATSDDFIGQRRRKTLNFAYKEYRELAAHFDREDRSRLDAHFGLVQRLGQRLEGLRNLSCQSSERPAASFEKYDQRFDAFSDIIATSFSCDITRVISLSLGEMPTQEFGAESISDKVHKGIAHYIHDDPEKHSAMSTYVHHHARQISRLISTLESVPESSGGSLMDNTLIVWGSELGDGWHGYNHYCPVLIGGEWAFSAGRYLYWPHTTPAEMRVPTQLLPNGTTTFSGIPHQHLLVSIARAMAVELDHVGLKYIRGQRGNVIDLTGPMKELV